MLYPLLYSGLFNLTQNFTMMRVIWSNWFHLRSACSCIPLIALLLIFLSIYCWQTMGAVSSWYLLSVQLDVISLILLLKSNNFWYQLVLGLPIIVDTSVYKDMRVKLNCTIVRLVIGNAYAYMCHTNMIPDAGYSLIFIQTSLKTSGAL